MRNSSIITLVVAIFLGFIAVAVMNKKMSGKSEAIPMTEVLVAKQDLVRGIDISADVVELKSVATNLVGEGAITKLDDSIDRMLLVPLAKGEVLLGSRLGPKGESGLAVQIREGMRAFTIETPKLSTGVGGMIQPGNRVDIILTVSENNPTNISDFSGGGSSSVLLQNVEVLAVDRRTDSPGAEAETKKSSRDLKEARSITLLVTPDQSALLTLGQTKGTLNLSLRHPNDAGFADTRQFTFRDIQTMREGPRSFAQRVGSALAALSQINGEGKSDSDGSKQSEEAKTGRNQKVQVDHVTKPQLQHNNYIRVVRGQQEELVLVRGVSN